MKIDVLTPSQLPYPGQAVAQPQCGAYQPYAVPLAGAGAYQPPARDGLFNSIFTPGDLAYPLPIIVPQGNSQSTGNSNANQGCASAATTQPGASGNSNVNQACPCPPATSQPSGNGSSGNTQSTSTGTASSGSASSSPVAPHQPAGQIIINVGVPAAQPSSEGQSLAASTGSTPPATTPAATSPLASPAATAPVASTPPIAAAPTIAAPVVATPPIQAMPIIGGPPLRRDVFSTAYSYNPRLRSRQPRAQEEMLEEMLGEKVTAKMLTAMSMPVAFVVPDGCNALDIFVDGIEVNPDVGSNADLDLVVATGAAKLTDNGMTNVPRIQPGDQITVTIPWRYASWVELAPEHLRAQVTAHFYVIENA